jgi:hypothetical protein
VDGFSISANPAFVQGIAINLARHDAVELGDIRGKIVRMRHFRPGLLQELAPLIAEYPAELVVDFDAAFGWRGDRHADQPQIEVTAEAFLACA